MARQRNLHPDFFTDGRVVQASPLARLLFAGMWCLADREGRLEDKPIDLKIRLLPFDACDAAALLLELVGLGLVLRYLVDGRSYLLVPNFPKYQHPHPKEVKSRIPAPAGTPPPAAGTPSMTPEPRQGDTQVEPRLNPAAARLNPGDTQVAPSPSDIRDLRSAGSSDLKAHVGCADAPVDEAGCQVAPGAVPPMLPTEGSSGPGVSEPTRVGAGGTAANQVPFEPDRRKPDSPGARLRVPPVDTEPLREAWNATCAAAGLAVWVKTPVARGKLATRALERRELDGPEGWRAVFERIAASPFCLGAGGGAWRADIDWALRPDGKKTETAQLVLEGKFDDGRAGAAPPAREVSPCAQCEGPAEAAWNGVTLCYGCHAQREAFEQGAVA